MQANSDKNGPGYLVVNDEFVFSHSNGEGNMKGKEKKRELLYQQPNPHCKLCANCGGASSLHPPHQRPWWPASIGLRQSCYLARGGWQAC